MYQLTSYLKFLLHSTNQHGVHSPFVYNYVTKCLYAKQNCIGSKTGHVLLSSIAYFNVKNVWFPDYNEPLLQKVKAEYPSVNLDKEPYDLIFIDISNTDITATDWSTYIHNDTLVIIGAIYKNKANTTRWGKIKELERVTVSIDMYQCGAVFFRKEQATEHFTIRI